MRIESTWLRSRVARRLLGVFLGGALVPIAAVAWLAYAHVTEQLYAQSDRRLHQASKATGLAVLARLQDLERELQGLDAGAAPDALRQDAAQLADRLHWLALTRSGKAVALIGTVPSIPPIDSAAEGHLATGRTLVRTVEEDAGPVRVLVCRRLDAETELVAEARLAALLDISPENTLPPLAEFCLLDERRRVVRCSVDGPVELPEPLRAVGGRAPPKSFEWTHAGVEYLARGWTIFMRPQFHTHGWTVVLAEPRDAVLAPVARFRTAFPLAMLGSFLAVSLLMLRQIHRRLGPLDELRSGTERVARQDFSVPVEVQSRDEFEEVARSFNAMAQRLGDHFARLSKLIEVDRSILAATEVPALSEALVNGVRELYPCEAVAIALAPPDRADAVLCFLSPQEGGAMAVHEAPAFDDATAAPWLEEPGLRSLDLDSHCPPQLERLRECGAQRALVVPLLLAGRLAGLVACTSRDGDQASEGGEPFIERVGDQAAQALANAYTLEEKRVLAYYDSLTGLPNRLMFRERAEQELRHFERSRGGIALCLLDLDGFKRINDGLGHLEGDALLCAVAGRLEPRLREGSLARLGGDEFTILVRDANAAEAAARVADRILGELSQPFEIEGRQIFVSASVGIATYPDNGRDLDTLLRNADTAMYEAKAEGGGRFRFFTDAMHERAVEQMQLEHELRGALEREEFALHYQPVVDLGTRRIVSGEALVRWQHPERGLLLPDAFISLAEDTRMIVPLGEWILREACEASARWYRSGHPIRIAVNLSTHQASGSDIVTTVRRALLDSNLYPQYLELELTETALMSADDAGRAALRELQQMGVRISLDDFGTGYSSLGYLRQFRFDHLKIDRSFVRDVTRKADDEALVRTILAMARSLKLRAIAEGIEEEEQLTLLRELGCETGQGYLISKPLPESGFDKLLRDSADE